MKHHCRNIIIALLAALGAAGTAGATPSTQVWIPSTDVQPYGSVHLGVDNYSRTSRQVDPATGAAVEKRNNIYDFGVTAGVSPLEKLQVEVGVDYLTSGDGYDDHPVQFNAKLGTPENSLYDGSPALAVGGFGFGTHRTRGSATRTDFNIGYLLASRTLPALGRLSAGGYLGNSTLLRDAEGKSDPSGLLLSYDRTMTEISDRLWVGVDYMGGNNSFGAVSFGASWAFAKNVSLLVGYDIFNDKATGGRNTVTTQIDINFP